MTPPSSKPDYASLMKEALLELKQLRRNLSDIKRAQTEPIAIVGMSCRFPGGVDGPESFWTLLRDGVDAIRPVPGDRWDQTKYFDADPNAPGRMSTRFGGFLDAIDQFEPAFFGISPREARSLDPQQRLLLEVTWEALEIAGQSPTGLYGTSTGVFVGMSTFDYALHQVGGHLETEDLDRIDGYVATGSTMSPAAGRLSYVLGLNGPSMVVDTACSSSLVATHLAVSSLRARECDMALVGGVNLILRPEWNVNFTKAHMLAPDGRCKTFDASADGYTRGEGCGVVVLQRLSDAIAQRRNIFAVVRGSAVNQDGASGGLTVPSGPSQEQVIRRALDSAGVRPEDVSYVETHGTGTPLGDPIEVAALGAVFGPARSRKMRLRIGSVKTNVGHLEAAAGVAGLIKVALSLYREEIPPHLHFRNRNPLIGWDELPIDVPVARTAWTRGDTPRCAGISSFGFTGTNAHVVLEEAPPKAPSADERADAPPERPLHVLTLSGRTAAGLQQLAARYERHLGQHPDLRIADVAFTANTARAHLRHRLALVVDSASSAQSHLADFAAGRTAAGALTGEGAERPKIVFLFTGQGAQYAGMGRALYDTQPVFRATIDRCDALARPFLQRSLLDVLYPADPTDRAIDDTAYTQPALFAVECALADLWRSWGVEPDAVMGHSIGEYAAAYVAGIFSLEDGLTLIVKRAQLMQGLSDAGQMVAVQTTPKRAAAALAPFASEVSIAAINGPQSVVISGATSAVNEVVAALKAEGIPVKPLRVSHAFHSPLMRPMMPEFERAVSGIRLTQPRIEIASNVTGRLSSTEMTDPQYWVRHIVEPVRFADGIAACHERGYQMFVEIGPSSTLLAMGRLCLTAGGLAWLPSLRAGNEWDQIVQTLAELYVRGVTMDWRAFDATYSRRLLLLPTYPFQRQRYWVDIIRRPQRTDSSLRTGDTGAVHEGQASTDPAAIDDYIYELQWHQQPRVADSEPVRAEGRWIVVGGEEPLTTAVSAQLEARGARCKIVRPDQVRDGELGSLYSNISVDTPVRAIVNLASADIEPAVTFDAVARGDALETMLHVVRAAATADRKSPSPVWCVTRGAVVAGGATESPVAIAHTPEWGFGRTVALEHPEIWGGLIDLDPRGDAERDADALVHELLSRTNEDQIAFRRDGRYVPRLIRRTTNTAATVSLDSGGTFLVAGGLGALGLHAARWLVSRGARTLVLATRRGTAAPGVDMAVRQLEAIGAHVHLVRADISEPADVDRVLAQIAASPHPLRGIVHAAGVDARVPLHSMTEEDLRSMVASKVRGAWLLHDRTRNLQLDLFVCCSSVSSIWGAPQRAHYAAANAFLDGLAHERRRQGLAALSVNWGPWAGGGMGTDQELAQAAQSGQRALDPAVALRALDTLTASQAVQATVADLDWPRFRAVLSARRARPLLSHVNERQPQAASATSSADWLERLRGEPAGERARTLQELLRREVAETLGFGDPQEIPTDQSVFDLGMDSLRAVDLAVRLQRHLGLDRAIHFLDCPRIDALAARLLAQAPIADDRAQSTTGGDIAAARPAPMDRQRDPAIGESSQRAETGIISGYSPDREHEIVEFSRVLWPNRPASQIAARWRWMFVESARRIGLEPNVWIYRDSGRIVAHHGAMPVRVHVGDEELTGGWFVDTMVLDSHRGTATGARLIVPSNEAFPVGLSLGQTEMMRKIALRLGWHQVAPLQTFVLLLRPHRVFKHKVNPLVAGVASAGIDARQYVRRVFAGSKDHGLEVRSIDQFDQRHDRLWDAVKGEYSCAVTRDASYLNWKYVAQPGQNFIRLEFHRNGQLAAVAVLLIDDPGVIYRYRRAFIVDLVVRPSDSRLVLGVLDAIRRRCDESQVDAIFFHLIGDTLEKSLRAYGFTRRDATRFLLVNPLRVSSAVRERLLSPSGWLITMGDSDIDRPWDTDGDRVQVRTSAAIT